MIEIVQKFGLAPMASLETDDAPALGRKLSAATQLLADRQPWHAAERFDTSAVMINDHTAFRTDWTPFAGRRESGYGIGGIPWTMHEMTSEKMIVFHPLSKT